VVLPGKISLALAAACSLAVALLQSAVAQQHNITIDRTFGSPQTLTTSVSKHHPGDTISVTWVTPSGQHETGSLTLTPGPPL